MYCSNLFDFVDNCNTKQLINDSGCEFGTRNDYILFSCKRGEQKTNTCVFHLLKQNQQLTIKGKVSSLSRKIRADASKSKNRLMF